MPQGHLKGDGQVSNRERPGGRAEARWAEGQGSPCASNMLPGEALSWPKFTGQQVMTIKSPHLLLEML